MVQGSQADAVRQIEEALLALRLGGGRGGPRPPWGAGPPPWAGGPGPGPLGARRRHDHEAHEPGMRGRGMHGGARIRLLEFLAAADAGARIGISEVAEAVGVDQPRASRLVADGAARGFVTRSVDPRDARKSIVELTDAGRQMLETVRAGRTSAVTDALSDFTPDETVQLAELLSRFAAAWPR